MKMTRRTPIRRLNPFREGHVGGSVRLFNCFSRAGFKSVGQVLALTEPQLRALDGFGNLPLREWRALRIKHGHGDIPA